LQHVPRILDASEIWCQGFSEPDAGSDLASLRTRAELVGDDYVINGQKIWTSTGLQATHMLLLARTDPAAPKHSGITALLVPMDAAGIERRPIRQISGDEDFAEVFFTDVTVSASAVLGPVNQGWQVTRTTLGYERAGVAVLASRLHEEVLATVRGGNIPAALSDDVVARYVESRVLTWLGEQLLDRLAAGQAPGAEQSVIKLVWSETGQRLAATRLALTGAAAGRAGAAVDGYLNSRQLTIAAGTTQIVKNILAERVLGLPRD
jgi:alkylation response protein AidB-like acyl-CoA dehydrogenase